MQRPRWVKWISLGVTTLAVGVWPVTARTGRTRPSPPLVAVVHEGDSMWTIARKHGDPNRDVRAVVARIMQANHIDPAHLQPGQRLQIPSDCLRPREH